MTKNLSLILLLLGSIFALVFAYISQFVFDFQPCILCLYQRWPFFAVATLTLLSLAFSKSEKVQKILLLCCILLLLINCGLAFYHVGVEQKIFTGPTTCSSEELNNFENLEDLKNALMNTEAIRCDQPSFVFLGLSMAGWNFFYCLFLALSAYLLNRKAHMNLLRKSR
jgi:disulfide bond formation protein DsbB